MLVVIFPYLTYIIYSMFKASAIVAGIFCMEYYSVIQVTHSLLFTGTAIILIYLRIFMTLGIMGDPFVPFENLFCAIAFGGMLEAYQRVIKSDQKGSSANGDVHHQHHKVKKS